MWGRPGPFRGNPEDRFIPNWNRDCLTAPKSHINEQPAGSSSGRDPLPFGFPGQSRFPIPQFTSREKPVFGFGAQDGSRAGFRVEMLEQAFHARDFPSSDFQGRDAALLHFRSREMPRSEFVDRENHPLDFLNREALHMDYRKRDAVSFDYRSRMMHAAELRGREISSLSYGERESVSDFRSRGIPSSDFRDRGTRDLDLRGRDHSQSNLTTFLDLLDKDGAQTSFEGQGTSDMDLREHDATSLDFDERSKPKSDQDFREWDISSAVDFVKRLVPPPNTSLLEFLHTLSADRLPDQEIPGGSTDEIERRVRDPTLENPSFKHHELRGSNVKSQGLLKPEEPSHDFRNSQGHLSNQQDPNKVSTDVANMQQAPAGESNRLQPSGHKQGAELDFLGIQDTDYRNMEYRDVDMRFSYGHGRTTKDSLQILDAFQAPDGTPVQGVRLTSSKPGYSHGSVCVEFSLLEEAIGCMEANQGEASNVGFEEQRSKCNTSREKLEEKSDGRTQKEPLDLAALSSSPVTQKEKDSGSPPTTPSRSLQELPHPAESPADPEQKKREDLEKQQPPKAPRKCTDKGLHRREGQNRSKKEIEKKHQHGEDMHKELESRSEQICGAERDNQTDSESKTIMVKNFLVGTTPEIIVKALEPHIHLSTSRIRIIKNKAMRFGTTYGFIEMDSHEEALRVIHLLQMLDPPLSIDGQTLSVNLAVGRRREDPSSYQPDHSENSSHGKGKKREGASRGRHTSGEASRQASSDGSSYIYDSELGVYYDPLSGMYYDPKSQKEVPLGEKSPSESTGKHEGQVGSKKEKKSFPKETSRERRERRQNRKRTREPLSPKRPRRIARRARTSSSEREDTALRRRERKEPRRTSRTFSENKNSSGERKSDGEDLFKKPFLPPMVVKKEETPEMPKVNPLIGLIGEYGGDSDSDSDSEEEEQKKVIKSEPEASQPQPKPKNTEGDEGKLTDWGKLACLLCRRQFPNKEGLIRHQQLSDLHKQNMAIHMKIKQSEKELAYLERKEKEVECKERGGERKGKSMTLVSPERKRLKHTKDASGDRELKSRVDTDSNEKESQELLRDSSAKSARRWKGGRKEADLASQGKPQKRPANESYRDAVRKAMFALYKELE